MVNREYKDRLFKFIFDDKEKLLALYNALHDTDYQNTEDLEVVTLEDVLYMKMKNDISFILDWRLNLFEHQSTINPNMPLRGFMYFGKQYGKFVAAQEEKIYGSKLLEIPTPQYTVFCNSSRMREERQILKLSDAFKNKETEGCMELKATVLNINHGKNRKILEKCRPLMEYSLLVEKIKIYCEGMQIEEAVDKAVQECIDENILKEILIKHRAEVKDLVLEEYDEEKVLRYLKQEAIEIAKEEMAEKVREEVTEKVREEVTEKVREEITEKVREEVIEKVREEIIEKVREEAEEEWKRKEAQLLERIAELEERL